jgi:hypothetical protein
MVQPLISEIGKVHAALVCRLSAAYEDMVQYFDTLPEDVLLDEPLDLDVDVTRDEFLRWYDRTDCDFILWYFDKQVLLLGPRYSVCPYVATAALKMLSLTIRSGETRGFIVTCTSSLL